CHVERVCRYKVGHRHVVADEELPAVHVLLQDRRHVEEVLTCDRYLRREPLLRRVERGVARDAPERLLQLGRGEQEPLVDLCPGSEPGGQEAFLRVLLREVEDDRDRFREDEVAIDEDGQLASGVHREKLGAPMLALRGIYVNELELNIQLAQRPEDADRTGRREPIELHGLATSFSPERRPRSGARCDRRQLFLQVGDNYSCRRPPGGWLAAAPRQEPGLSSFPPRPSAFAASEAGTLQWPFGNDVVAIDSDRECQNFFIVSRGGNYVIKTQPDANGALNVGAPSNVVRFETGNIPTGIAVDAKGQRAYVNNEVNLSVSILDLDNDTVIARDVPSSEPPAPGTFAHAVEMGKLIFFTALGVPDNALVGTELRDIDAVQFRGKQSADAWSSCGSCHPNGLADGVTWIFPDGPRQAIPMDGCTRSSTGRTTSASTTGAPQTPDTGFPARERARRRPRTGNRSPGAAYYPSAPASKRRRRRPQAKRSEVR